jgi:TonB family protein
MGYKALLFCPDEKTARTVTQVLGDLEFSVESCTEPFAAVKKLMSDHFDAIVVDCDNEQNATLLFKSARNSTSNQASLAVAVVEGQAGVAKAFRIGANLVLTKPINVEQAKGTLRVARGLLRKGEPAKPATSAPTPAASASTPAPPARPAASHPAPPAKPVAPAAVSTPRPASPLPPKPSSLPPRPVPAVAASSAPTANHDEDPLEINVDEPVSSAPVLPSPKLPTHSIAAAAAETKPAFSAAPANSMGSFGGGAASAPAPAREVQAPQAAPAAPSTAAEADEPLFAKAAEAAASSSPAPTFTFGGANVPVESSGNTKKLLLIAVAVVLVSAGVYAGYSYFQGRSAQPAASAVTTPAPAAAAPVSTTPAPKPSNAQPASSAPSTPVSSPSSQPAEQPAATAKAPAIKTTSDDDSSLDDAAPPTKSSSSGSTTGKSAASAKDAASPHFVKGGAIPTTKKAPVADTAAPSMIGIATPGAGGPPPDLGSSETSALKPRLQTVQISQGVSRGLLMKKVNPTYPRAALNLRIDGTVELMATISKSGDISTVKVLSGDAQLTKAAVDAVKQWKYKPYLLNGEPVEIQTQVTVKFELPH